MKKRNITKVRRVVTFGMRKDMIREGLAGYVSEKSVLMMAMFYFLTWVVVIGMFAV